MRIVLRNFVTTILASLLFFSAQSALFRAQAAPMVQSHKEAIVVELKIEGYMDFTPIEVPVGRGRDAGVGVGCGGGRSHPVDIAGYSCGVSVVKLKKRSATVHLTVTLRYVGGGEKSIDEQFLVTRGQ